MVTVILKTGKSTQYIKADEIKTEQTEYLIYEGEHVVGQIPRENVEQFFLEANRPEIK